MLDDRRPRRDISTRVGGAARVMARIAGLLTASVLASGCSLLPFGGGSKKAEPLALRPQLHEAKANEQPDCIAQVPSAEVEVVATAQAGEPGCTACRCKSDGATAASAAGAARRAIPPALREGGAAIGFVPATSPAAEETLQNLMDGNKRFVEGEPENVYRLPQRPGDSSRRPPAAMVLACSDWSIQPESAFDARAGELFVVRVAGNVADAAVVDSARYAVEQFDVPLIVVLGHEECGAVASEVPAEPDAVEGRTAGHAVDADGAPETGDVARAVHANVEEVVAHLRRADPVLSARIAAGKLKIVGACYDETNGQIALEPEAPSAPSAPSNVTASARD